MWFLFFKCCFDCHFIGSVSLWILFSFINFRVRTCSVDLWSVVDVTNFTRARYWPKSQQPVQTATDHSSVFATWTPYIFITIPYDRKIISNLHCRLYDDNICTVRWYVNSLCVPGTNFKNSAASFQYSLRAISLSRQTRSRKRMPLFIGAR